MTKIFAKIVYEDGGTSVVFGTEKDVPEWEEQFRQWEEEEDFSTDGDSIQEVGTTDDVEKLLSNINQLIEDNYE